MEMDKKHIECMLLDLLPQPATIGKEIIAGDPPKVIVRLSEEGVVIAPYRAKWSSSYELEPLLSNEGLVSWEDLPVANKQLRAFLSQKIDDAQKVRKSTFKICSHCNQSTPPEWMHDENTCQACASEKLGVVY